ncbi:hypothetical protein D3C83_15850 [compost metagenome]
MGGQRRCHQLLVHQRARPVFGAQPALLHHHPDLLRKLLGREREVHHAVGFELQSKLQMALLQHGEVAREIVAGEGVVAPPRGRDDPGILPRRRGGSALEHHVLEHVRDAGGAVHFVNAADAIPRHHHRHRRASVGLHDDAQTVGKLALCGIVRRQARQGHERQHAQHAKQLPDECHGITLRQGWVSG